jgi:Cu/Ag efflux protein CusF
MRPFAVAVLIAAGAALTAPLSARAQPVISGGAAVGPGSAAASETLKASATVVGIDAKSREITLRRGDGKVFTVAAGDQVRNFDRIQVGDTVNVEFTQAITLDLRKGGAGIREKTERETMSRAPAGARPAAAVGREVTILADVVAVDEKERTVTLRGPQGRVVELSVQDPEQLSNVKQGDQVQAVYTESLAVAVEPASASAGK